MFASIVICCLGTHRHIPWLRQAPERRASSPRRMLAEAWTTLKNPSFVAVVLSGIFTAIALGMKSTLDIYWTLYLFGLSQGQLAILTLFGLVGTGIGMALGPVLIRRLGKRGALMAIIAACWALISLPLTLWLAGLTPPRGSDALFTLLV